MDISLIFIQKYRTISGWFGGKYPELNKMYSISYREIGRVGYEYAKPPPPPPQIVKSTIMESPETKIRDLNCPHDRLLFSIEKGVQLRSLKSDEDG